MRLSELTDYLDEFLGIRDISDHSWNGLQIEGKSDVNKVICAVDSGCLTFKEEADLIVVHHGLFWRSIDPSLRGLNKKRVDMLTRQETSLYAAHLPLDRHPKIGNNALLLEIIGAQITGEFHHSEGKNISWIGKMQPTKLSTITKKIDSELDTESKVLAFGKEMIETVAVCSGGPGVGIFNEAIESGVDLYIAGEQCDIYHMAKDAGMNVIFAGHHATETLGVKALAAHLKKEFSLDVKFVDIPTGL